IKTSNFIRYSATMTATLHFHVPVRRVHLSACLGSFTSGRWSTSVHVYRQNQQRDSYHQCENPCFRHARLENGFPRALGIETDIDCVPTSIPLHNLLGKIRHSFVHPGALGNSVSTKTLSIDFILIDHDGTIEG